ncbi:hypothetical protein HaLaN_02464 [Haematococcus lacustris]|uniref:Uncharacterized protein n=1 Tax=Haematococcus lacustris TaxID=44745 RepID=A0A699YL98_HAELA|nr:hypothetical protein HaLaN_02464 [Haematococcus lacustris]
MERMPEPAAAGQGARGGRRCRAAYTPLRPLEVPFGGATGGATDKTPLCRGPHSVFHCNEGSRLRAKVGSAGCIAGSVGAAYSPQGPPIPKPIRGPYSRHRVPQAGLQVGAGPSSQGPRAAACSTVACAGHDQSCSSQC